MNWLLKILLSVFALLIAVATLLFFGVGFQKIFPGLDDGQQPDRAAYKTEVPFTDTILYAEFLSKINQEENLDGYVYLTGRKSSADDASVMNTYVYSVLGKNLSEPLLPYPIWFLQKNETNNEHIFITQPVGVNRFFPTVFTKVEDSEPSRLNLDIEDALLVSERRLPELSPNGEHYLNSVLISGTGDQSGINIFNPDAWVIKTASTSATSTDVYFSNGYGAKWAIGGDYIVYVKKGGVYGKKFPTAESAEEEKEELLVSAPSSFGILNHIAVSPSGDYLAVAFPSDQDVGDSYLDLYKLNIDSGVLSTSLVSRLVSPSGESLLEPQFSPEGRYMSALLSSRLEGNPHKLVIFDFSVGKFVDSFSLNDFVFESLFATDWVKAVEF